MLELQYKALMSILLSCKGYHLHAYLLRARSKENKCEPQITVLIIFVKATINFLQCAYQPSSSILYILTCTEPEAHWPLACKHQAQRPWSQMLAPRCVNVYIQNVSSNKQTPFQGVLVTGLYTIVLCLHALQ